MSDTKVFISKLDDDGQPNGELVEVPGVVDFTLQRNTDADFLQTLLDATSMVLKNVTTVSLVQAGKCFGIGRTKAYELYHRGEFPVNVRNIAGALRVRLKDIEAFLDNN